MSDSFIRQNSADQDKKLDAELVLINGMELYRLRKSSPSEALIMEDTGTGILYVGTAPIGAALSDPVWKIKQILTSGLVLRILWADGDSQYDNIWDSRASLTYL